MELSKRQQRRQQIGEMVAHPAVVALPFERALEVFLAAQEGSGHSRETCSDYEVVIRLFCSFMATAQGYTAIEQVTEADIYGWLAYLRNNPNRWGQPYSSRSIQTYSRDVKVFFRWLIEHRYVAMNPMEQVKTPKVERPLIRVYTEEEL